MSEIKILKEGGTGEIEEKKSRFIATVRPVKNEDEAIAFINEMKKKYWDARHNCSAYIIGDVNPILRYSDDGEPQGTAGKPILEVLLGSEIKDICVVVTRYFGGTLLGTGGLVRAYTQATQEGLKDCTVAVLVSGINVNVSTDYNSIGKLLYILGNHRIAPNSSDYGADVSLNISLPLEAAEGILKEFTEATCGKCSIEKLDECMIEVPCTQ